MNESKRIDCTVFGECKLKEKAGCQDCAWRKVPVQDIMKTAPKDQLILLLLPEFDVHQESWWPGFWSSKYQKWVIRTPYSMNKKAVVCTASQPINWAPFPGGGRNE